MGGGKEGKDEVVEGEGVVRVCRAREYEAVFDEEEVVCVGAVGYVDFGAGF